MLAQKAATAVQRALFLEMATSWHELAVLVSGFLEKHGMGPPQDGALKQPGELDPSAINLEGIGRAPAAPKNDINF